ncbi:MAG TPA: helix-turn-helix domain-containing protein [Dehalococcoidia bacterium]|nr:helix-turn-helix domain-containing protein [Dehalococcoidia bacterium]
MTVYPKSEPRLMTVTELAEYLRISRASVYRLVRSRQVPVSSVGRQLRFRRDSIDRWLQGKERHSYGL